MKKLIILIGNQGSGKTTLANQEFPNYVRISQDDQGKVGHMKLFMESLQSGKSIVLDRINHLRSQREGYIYLAKKHGYTIKAHVMNTLLSTALENLLHRESHPTVSSSLGEAKLKNILENYYRTYEYPTMREGFDEINIRGEWDPYMLDLSSILEQNFPVCVIGDVHGCDEELETLLNKVEEFDPEMTVVFCGDLLDKGPKIREIVERFKKRPSTYSTKGNHDYKLHRYLIGNKVSISGGLQETISQCQLEDINSPHAKELLSSIESMPLIIKLSDNDYVVHGGINPEKDITNQHRENLLFTRNWNPVTKSFNTKGDKPWFEHYPEDKPNIYFGHQIYEKAQVKKNVFAMDGGCVHGDVLRAVILYPTGERKVIEVQAKAKYCEKYSDETPENILAPYESLAGQGLLRKVENEDLVLYNYTDKCTFERCWNEYTIKARGIIFEKATSKVIARPFPKFFNLNENESTELKNIPLNEDFEASEKMDGSLGIIYYYKGKWNAATRGSLSSDQAVEAQKMLDSGMYKIPELDKDYTHLVEIIYPENKILVNYGDRRELVLIGKIHTETGKDVHRVDLVQCAELTGFGLAKIYKLSFKELLEKQQIIPKDEEGWVLKFLSSGLRIKIKGSEYVRLQKIISRISPLSLWEVMSEGRVSTKYLEQIPEEIYGEVKPMVEALEARYQEVLKEIESEFGYIGYYAGSMNTPEDKKTFALTVQEAKISHKAAMFLIMNCKVSSLDSYILKLIRPDGNKLE